MFGLGGAQEFTIGWVNYFKNKSGNGQWGSAGVLDSLKITGMPGCSSFIKSGWYTSGIVARMSVPEIWILGAEIHQLWPVGATWRRRSLDWTRRITTQQFWSRYQKANPQEKSKAMKIQHHQKRVKSKYSRCVLSDRWKTETQTVGKP